MDSSILNKIDYSVLKATITRENVLEAAETTKRFNFATLCVFPKHIDVARDVLPTEKVSTVIGFPLSAVPLELKLKEVEYAINFGVGELDVVVDVGAVKGGYWSSVEEELQKIRKIAEGKIIKLIFECCYLNEREKRTLCQLAVENGWDYLKTSTGYGTYGATYDDVELLVECSKGRAKVKAAGGIRNYESVKRFIELGAERVGTSSGREIAHEVLHSR